MSITLPVSLPELISRHESGESFQFLHFWGHRSTRDGRITASSLSETGRRCEKSAERGQILRDLQCQYAEY